ncbi:hypothetical protein [Streptomyces radiopugnans]|uniref:hypothetical protein n=1 Tax=Streptomyces radiopugnans TaxID=403935 RepID=UPI003F1A0E2B
MISLLTGAAVVGAVWAITASAGGDGEGDPGTFDLRGTLTLKGSYGDFDSDCYGLDGYDDIGPGAAVTVYDASGDAVATGELVRPQYTSSACLYQVEVDDVPRGSKLYQVEVSHRGRVTLDAEEAEAGELAVSLGD